MVGEKYFDLVYIYWIYFNIIGKNRYFYFFFCLKFFFDILIICLVGFKFVWIVYDYLGYDSKFFGLELWMRWLFVKLVDRIICLNKMIVEIIVKEYKFNFRKVIVIFYGYYWDVYDKLVDLVEVRKELNLLESGKVYLNLGLLKFYKGIENLLWVW